VGEGEKGFDGKEVPWGPYKGKTPTQNDNKNVRSNRGRVSGQEKDTREGSRAPQGEVLIPPGEQERTQKEKGKGV